jgi:hypothetical protein
MNREIIKKLVDIETSKGLNEDYLLELDLSDDIHEAIDVVASWISECAGDKAAAALYIFKQLNDN